MTWRRERENGAPNAYDEWERAIGFTWRSDKLKRVGEALRDYCNTDNNNPVLLKSRRCSLINAYITWRLDKIHNSTRGVVEGDLVEFVRKEGGGEDIAAIAAKSLIDQGNYVEFLRQFTYTPAPGEYLYGSGQPVKIQNYMGGHPRSKLQNPLFVGITRMADIMPKGHNLLCRLPEQNKTFVDPYRTNTTVVTSTSLLDLQNAQINRAPLLDVLRQIILQEENWYPLDGKNPVYTTLLTGCSFVVRKTQNGMRFAHFQPDDFQTNATGKITGGSGMNGAWLCMALGNCFYHWGNPHNEEIWIYGRGINQKGGNVNRFGGNPKLHVYSYGATQSASIMGSVAANGEGAIYAQVQLNHQIDDVVQIYPNFNPNVIA